MGSVPDHSSSGNGVTCSGQSGFSSNSRIPKVKQFTNANLQRGYPGHCSKYHKQPKPNALKQKLRSPPRTNGKDKLLGRPPQPLSHQTNHPQQPRLIISSITCKSNNSIYNIPSISLEPGKLSIVTYVNPKGNLKCIKAFITFETEAGFGRGVMRLIRDVGMGNKWRIYPMFTSVWDLKDTPDEQREFIDSSPAVLIVGDGHSGLMTAARPGMLGVKTLAIDIHERAGDCWRKRYHDLVLHGPCHTNVIPYLPALPNWPVLTPKDKMADFLEHSTALLILARRQEMLGSSSRKKTIGNHYKRVLHLRHVIQATGLNGEPRLPQIPDMESFKGKIMHTDDSDLPAMSSPAVLFNITGSDTLNLLTKADQPFLKSLSKAGFLLIKGPPPSILTLPIVRAGGFYIDVGASSLIASGAISIKSDPISHLTPATIAFQDGSELEADEVICATGYENGGARTRKIFGDEVVNRREPI
ncbi:hypothetical protein B0J14DRAFT_654816 [Halenospora varia]|nr:hypothetical protein B0J14DRAFT_654816 [Halenospora varia]